MSQKGIGSRGPDFSKLPKLDAEEKTAILRKEKGAGSFAAFTH
jgi:hypothetical protein